MSSSPDAFSRLQERLSSNALTRTGLRNRYPDVAEVLARRGSRGRLGLAEVVAAAAALAGPLRRTPRAHWDSAGLYGLAYFLTGFDDDHWPQALDVVRLGHRAARAEGQPRRYVSLELQLAFALGRHEEVRRRLRDPALAPNQGWQARTDLLNPYRFGGDAQRWAQSFAADFTRHGLAAPRVAEGDGHPFDRVTTDAEPGSVDGPLVTISMGVWDPGPSLETAVTSLTRQTWGNLQVLVVDDANPDPAAVAEIERVCAMDDRVHHVRAPRNGGTYRARNLALGLAEGAFMGFQDADDWSHPQRIERQMAPLLRRPDLQATQSFSWRVFEDLVLSNPVAPAWQLSPPSILFRRESVVARLGRFDDLRKAADTEFRERIETVFGGAAVETLMQPLGLYQLTTNSLSRGDFTLGWVRPARLHYRSAFRHWHREIRAGRASALLEPVPDGLAPHETPRPFPAPPELLGGRHPERPADVLVVADPRTAATRRAGLASELAALADAGLDVAITSRELLSASDTKREMPDADVTGLVQDGRVRWLPLEADRPVRTLYVRDPEALTWGLDPEHTRVRPERVVVAAPFPARGPAHSLIDPVVVERGVRDVLGLPVTWLPATEAVASSLVAAGAAGEVLAPFHAQAVPIRPGAVRDVVGSPVVGFVSTPVPDGVEREDLWRAASAAGDDVRVLRLDPVPVPGATWLDYDLRDVHVEEFLDLLDVVVVPLDPSWDVTPPRVVVQALGHGCAVVADPAYRAVLGDEGAAWAAAGEEADVLAGLLRDPDRLRALREAGRARCAGLASPAAYAAAMTPILGLGARAEGDR